MKKIWSRSWKASVQPRKQRKYSVNAPLHIARKLMSVNLSKDLRQKYKKRNIPVRKGDTVKIIVGQFKGKTGKVEKVNLKQRKVYVDSVSLKKRDGNKRYYPLESSNLRILELSLDDKLRRKLLDRK